MRVWVALGVALLGLGFAQSARWPGQPEYRAIAGAATAAGAALDRSYILAYPAQGSLKGTIVLVPGFLAGATNFEALARRLVLAAPGWAVWAWDRRANGLEDRRGFTSPDPWAYYQNYQLPEFPFLKDWWFLPYRLSLDISAYDTAMPKLRPRPVPFPVLALGAGRGLLPQVANFRSVGEVFPNSSVDIRIPPGLTHLDILTSRTGSTVGPIALYLQGMAR